MFRSSDPGRLSGLCLNKNPFLLLPFPLLLFLPLAPPQSGGGQLLVSLCLAEGGCFSHCGLVDVVFIPGSVDDTCSQRSTGVNGETTVSMFLQVCFFFLVLPLQSPVTFTADCSLVENHSCLVLSFWLSVCKWYSNGSSPVCLSAPPGRGKITWNI